MQGSVSSTWSTLGKGDRVQNDSSSRSHVLKSAHTHTAPVKQCKLAGPVLAQLVGSRTAPSGAQGTIGADLVLTRSAPGLIRVPRLRPKGVKKCSECQHLTASPAKLEVQDHQQHPGSCPERERRLPHKGPARPIRLKLCEGRVRDEGSPRKQPLPKMRGRGPTCCLSWRGRAVPHLRSRAGYPVGDGAITHCPQVYISPHPPPHVEQQRTDRRKLGQRAPLHTPHPSRRSDHPERAPRAPPGWG